MNDGVGLNAEHGAERRKGDRPPAAPQARGNRERGGACAKQTPDPGFFLDTMAHAVWRLRDLQRLAEMGVPGTTLMALRADFAIAVGQVLLTRGGDWWEPEGPDARLLLAVHDECGTVIDIAAVSTSSPDQRALRTGMGWALGAQAIAEAGERAAQHGHARLRLHSTPLGWLQSGCEGAAVIDWARALPLLCSLGDRVELRCDPGAGRIVQSRLQWGALPRVTEYRPQAAPASLAEQFAASLADRAMQEFHGGVAA